MRDIVVLFAALAVLVGAHPATSQPAPDPGVSDDTIKIGLHAPITGAVPLPSASVQRAADLYWRWLKLQGKTVNGRHVDVFLRNDNANPTQARSACKEMISKDRVFMLSGILQPQIVGSHQAQSCARFADKRSVPYTSLGHAKAGFGFDSYFATSETISGQARAMATVFVQKLKAKSKKNAVVFLNSAIYARAAEDFGNVLEDRGATLDLSRSTPITAGAAEAQTVVSELALLGIENVLLVVSPTFVLQILSAAENQGYGPNWTTIGFTHLLSDEGLDVMCNTSASVGGMLVTSPVPAFADRADFDPAYDLAVQAVYPDSNGGDMTTWLGWAASKQIHMLLEDAGRDLSRRRFIRSAEGGDRYATGIIPPFEFSKADHFGGRKSYLMRASCSDEEWSTLGRV